MTTEAPMDIDGAETLVAPPTADTDIRATKKNKKINKSSSVVYVGHLPWAFEEGQLKAFFSQFGDIKNHFLSRSRKSGHSRGYAFLQFEDASVAEIVAETMNGYFCLEKRLVCHVVPVEKIHPQMFRWRKRHVGLAIDRIRMDAKRRNRRQDEDTLKRKTEKLVRKEKEKRKRLAELGIDYDFPGYESRLEMTKEDVEMKKVTDISDNDKGTLSNNDDGAPSSDQNKTTTITDDDKTSPELKEKDEKGTKTTTQDNVDEADEVKGTVDTAPKDTKVEKKKKRKSKTKENADDVEETIDAPLTDKKVEKSKKRKSTAKDSVNKADEVKETVDAPLTDTKVEKSKKKKKKKKSKTSDKSK